MFPTASRLRALVTELLAQRIIGGVSRDWSLAGDYFVARRGAKCLSISPSRVFALELWRRREEHGGGGPPSAVELSDGSPLPVPIPLPVLANIAMNHTDAGSRSFPELEIESSARRSAR